MSRSKYAPETRAKAADEYLKGEGSLRIIAGKYGISKRTLRLWVGLYRSHGIAAFTRSKNRTYTKEFKTECAELVVSGKHSVDEVVSLYEISDHSVLRAWIKVYNANRELKDYIPAQEDSMARARRKTTIEERREAVKYCLAHGLDYQNTALKYGVSYGQVYTWVKKYQAAGESGLADLRGHHKTDDEVDELERLRRENVRLKRKLEESAMLVELLKKVKEFEGM